MPIRKIRGSWWIDFTWDKKRYRLRSPEDSKQGATLFEMHTRRQLIEDGFLPTARARRHGIIRAVSAIFLPFSQAWFDTYVRTNLSPATRLRYASVLKHHLIPFFGHFPLAKITSFEIDSYKTLKVAQGVHPKSLNNHLSILRSSLSTAVDWNILGQVPRIQWMKVPPPPFDFLNPAESRKLLLLAKEEPWRTMIRTALRTGLRLGELRALRWEDIDFERRMIAVRRSLSSGVEKPPKNNRFRYVPISQDLEPELLALRSRDGYVFATRPNVAATEGDCYRALQGALHQAQLRKLGWHTLRHTFASQLASAAVPIHVIQMFMGHSTLQMTMRYAHLAPSMFADAVNLLSLGERKSENTCLFHE